MKTAVAIVAVLLAAMAGSQAILPPIVETQMEAAITDSLEAVEAVRVDVAAFPALQLWRGYVPRLTVDARRASIDGLIIEALLVDAQNMQVDMKALRAGQGFVIQKADSLRVTATVIESDLNTYFAKESGTANIKVQLDPEQTTVSGDLYVLGQPVGVTVKGHFTISSATRVAFVVDDFLIANTRLPRFIIEPLAGKWAIQFDLAAAPVPLELTDIRIEKGRLYIYGQRPLKLPADQPNAK